MTEGLIIAVARRRRRAAAGVVDAASAVALFRTLPPAFAAMLRWRRSTSTAASSCSRARRVGGDAAVRAGAGAPGIAAHAHRRAPWPAHRHGRGSRLRSALVVGQVAVSIVLVVVRADAGAQRRVAGRDTTHLGFPAAGRDLDQRPRRRERLVRAARGGAGVRPARRRDGGDRRQSLCSSGRARSRRRRAPRRPGRGGRHAYTFVSPEYLPIAADPELSERRASARTRRACRRASRRQRRDRGAFWPGANPIGQAIRIERPEGRPVESCRATPRSRSSASSRT